MDGPETGSTKAGPAAATERRWAALTSAELAARIDARTVALLPVAAVEQHGPHLPLAVDWRLNEAIVEAALARLPAGPDVLVLPTLPVGLSPEHAGFAGTLTLRLETLLALWGDVADSAVAAGVRRLVVFNSHGGQTGPADLLVQDLRARHGMLAVAASWFDFGLPDGTVPAAEARHGIHAGQVETALMLAVAPEAVRRDRLGRFPSRSAALAGDFARIGPLGPAVVGWRTEDLHPSGACGDAAAASAEAGRAILDHLAGALAEVLVETGRLDWPPAGSPPG
jgi:creatinine amidohydrolase